MLGCVDASGGRELPCIWGAFLHSTLGVMVGHCVGEDGAWRAHSLRTQGLFRAAGIYVSPHCQTHTSSGLVTVLSSLFTELMLRLSLGTSYKD